MADLCAHSFCVLLRHHPRRPRLQRSLLLGRHYLGRRPGPPHLHPHQMCRHPAGIGRCQRNCSTVVRVCRIVTPGFAIKPNSLLLIADGPICILTKCAVILQNMASVGAIALLLLVTPGFAIEPKFITAYCGWTHLHPHQACRHPAQHDTCHCSCSIPCLLNCQDCEIRICNQAQFSTK